MHHNPPVKCPHSQLFTVRLWQEEMGEGAYETRSRVCHVLSGEVYYFRAWADLVAYLQQKVESQSVRSQSVNRTVAPLVQE